jgi:hypothetical protein
LIFWRLIPGVFKDIHAVDGMVLDDKEFLLAEPVGLV